MLAREPDRVLHATARQRIFGSDIEISVLAASGDRGDGHRLDDRERIALHKDAILERSRFGLVRVADEVVRAHGRARDRVPLATREEGGAAAAEQLRVTDF